MKSTKTSQILWTAFICFCFWELLVCSFSVREVLLGIIFSLLTAAFCVRFLIHKDTTVNMGNPIRLLMLLVYLVGPFFKAMWEANLDVAYRVFEKDMKLRPGIVRIPVNLKTEYGLTTMANSITRTPGTITVEIEEDEDGQNYFYVHMLDIKSDDKEEQAKIIKGEMEDWIRRIWEND